MAGNTHQLWHETGPEQLSEMWQRSSGKAWNFYIGWKEVVAGCDDTGVWHVVQKSLYITHIQQKIDANWKHGILPSETILLHKKFFDQRIKTYHAVHPLSLTAFWFCFIFIFLHTFISLPTSSHLLLPQCLCPSVCPACSCIFYQFPSMSSSCPLFCILLLKSAGNILDQSYYCDLQ